MVDVLCSLNKVHKQRQISISLQITIVTMVVKRNYGINSKDSSVHKHCTTGDYKQWQTFAGTLHFKATAFVQKE
jgi:hypothetical protein